MSYVKVYKYKKQISLDNGVTWQDVTPAEYVPSGDPIGYYDTYNECMAQYRTIQSGTTCVGVDKHNQDVYEVSYDNGVTWEVVSTSAGTLIEADSPDCGYVPPTPCECSAFTFDATSHTITDTAQSVTFNYSGCTKPDLSSASTYNWMLIANHEYNAETTVGYITANVSANTNSARTGILYTSLSGSTCQNLVISQQAPTPTPTSAKFVLTLNDSSTVSAECDSTSAISRSEISAYSASVTSAVIGDCTTSIGNWVFEDCISLTSCTIGSSVTSIGYHAFYYCSSLTSCTIGSSVNTIDAYAFYECSSLTSVTIPDSVTSIGYGAFWACGLTSIDIPNSVKTIGDKAFTWCSRLTSVDIPSGVTSIGDYAFEQCYNLTSVTVNATTPPTLGVFAFRTTNSCPIYVPYGSVNTYKSASGWNSYSSRIQAIP